MPTVTEIKNPDLGYCNEKDEHCMCIKCHMSEACWHSCFNCKEATGYLEKLNVDYYWEEEWKKIKEKLAVTSSPVRTCSKHIKDKQKVEE